MMRLPPGVPTTSTALPSRDTMVGVIELSMRLPGATALAVPPVRPNLFGAPAFTLKSSISLFSRNPAPVTTWPFPYAPFSVVVVATALPSASTTE
jgi:hypothetical protein